MPWFYTALPNYSSTPPTFQGSFKGWLPFKKFLLSQFPFGWCLFQTKFIETISRLPSFYCFFQIESSNHSIHRPKHNLMTFWVLLRNLDNFNFEFSFTFSLYKMEEVSKIVQGYTLTILEIAHASFPNFLLTWYCTVSNLPWVSQSDL